MLCRICGVQSHVMTKHVPDHIDRSYRTALTRRHDTLDMQIVSVCPEGHISTGNIDQQTIQIINRDPICPIMWNKQ